MKEKQKVSIRDVAREAGVSLSTVSNALADKDNVRPATKARVLTVADRIGYRASIVARALRMQRTFTLGVLLSDVTNPSSPDFLRGVEAAAQAASCSLLICNTDGDLDKQIEQMKTLIDRQVDGLIMISQHCHSEEVRQLLANASTPYALLQRRTADHAGDYIGGDNAMGIDAAVAHLSSLGHKRIAFLRGPVTSSSADERLAAFRTSMRQHGLVVKTRWIAETDYGMEGGYGTAKRFFSQKIPPTAIIAASDMNAIGILSAAKDIGIRVPEQLSVIGLDNIDLAALPMINLTTIALPRRKMGEAAASALLERIRGEYSGAPRDILFPMNLIVRQTTAAASDDDPPKKS